MTGEVRLSRGHVVRIRALAAELLPGSAESPAPTALLDFDQLVQRAAIAMGVESQALASAIDALPSEATWDDLLAFAQRDPCSFDMVSLLVVGAYFMSPTVLASLHLPSGARRPARPEQVVDELSTGVLDAVFERGCPVRTLAEVNRKAEAG